MEDLRYQGYRLRRWRRTVDGLLLTILLAESRSQHEGQDGCLNWHGFGHSMASRYYPFILGPFTALR